MPLAVRDYPECVVAIETRVLHRQCPLALSCTYDHHLNSHQHAPGKIMTGDEIHLRLAHALAPADIEVQDDSHLHAGHAGAKEGRHFTVRINSTRFTGLNRLARHRLVYDALGPLAPQGIHALAIVTQAPGEV